MPQSLSNIPVHLVFSTLHRRPCLAEDIQGELWAYMVGVLRNHGCVPIQVGGHVDHIHALFALSRTITVAQLVGKLKTASTHRLKEKYPTLKDFAWQEGYGAFGIGADDVQNVISYIQNQAEHHKKVSFQDEYRALLKEAGVDWREANVWD